MNKTVIEVAIYPFHNVDEYNQINAREDEELEIHGWNVHSLTADGDEIDDDDFDDFELALDQAEMLSDKYGVDIDYRY